MNVIIPQQQLNFLLEVLKDIYKSGGDRSRVYQCLQANLDLLDDRLVKLLRSWGTHRLTTVKPTAAFILAQTVINFSQLVEQFPQGNKETNLEIAIAGYETALLVFTAKVYPQDFANLQGALARAKQQRQEAIERQTINSSVARITREIEIVQATLKTLRMQLETLNTSPTKIDIVPLISAIRELHPPQDDLNISGIKLPSEEFNTAILYDIENLTKGYNFDRELLAKISLDKVINDIRKQHQFGKIAIQRANFRAKNQSEICQKVPTSFDFCWLFYYRTRRSKFARYKLDPQT